MPVLDGVGVLSIYLEDIARDSLGVCIDIVNQESGRTLKFLLSVGSPSNCIWDPIGCCFCASDTGNTLTCPIAAYARSKVGVSSHLGDHKLLYYAKYSTTMCWQWMLLVESNIHNPSRHWFYP